MKQGSYVPVDGEIREFKDSKKRFMILAVHPLDRDPLTNKPIDSVHYCSILCEDRSVKTEKVSDILESSEYLMWCFDKIFRSIFGYGKGDSNE